MIKKYLKYLAIPLLIWQMIMLFNFVSKIPRHSSKSTINSNLLQIRQDESNILRNPTWEQMNSNSIFKRSSAFYIIERSLLRIYVASRIYGQYFYDFRINFVWNNVIHNIFLPNVILKKHAAFGYQDWYSLNYNFNLIKYLNASNYDEILNSEYNFHLYISNSNKSSETTLYPIDVKLKYIRSRPNHEKKRGSILCSKCLWLKENDYQDLFWWIELHKQAGYSKVIFCNNTIPNTPIFNKLFEANKDFVELSQLNYLPNFLPGNKNGSNVSHNYLKYYVELGADFPVSSDLFNMMITNECFLNNTDKYLHIAVLDPDEIVMPRINSQLLRKNDNFNFISKLKFDSNNASESLINLENSCSNDRKNMFENYLLNITSAKNISFHFNMGFYIRERQVRQIMETIENYFQNKSTNTLKVHKITVFDLHPQSNDHNRYNFTFIIKNIDEVNYALNLCKIYKSLIQTFENSQKNVLEQYSSRFHRFFFIGGLLSSFACGKSIHHTDRSYFFSVHYPEFDKDYPDQSKIDVYGYDYGHLAHFRHNTEFHKSSQKEVSITELILDLNYLNCFYKPIIEKHSKVKLF